MIFYKKLKPIKAITFDLDDTLYENTSVIKKANAALIEFMYANFPETTKLEQDYWKKLQTIIVKQSPILKNDMGKLRLQTLLLGFENLGYSQSKAQNSAQECFTFFYSQRSNFVVRDEVHHVLAQLSKHIPLVAITNGNVDLEPIGIQEYFSQAFRASVDLLMKPNPDMFIAAQEYLKLPASNILHVGDNLHKDVYGAIKAGYQSAWYADDRAMVLQNESTISLPNVQLAKLEELLGLVF
ncbi:HAD-IA family hydrolase [Paraglaciecola aquimarina]|uniref:HAD-IA family hydrolase n=1 Tax=Paraglaciecola algarum TaxID=3050085 RepID=A0ABS9D328_9ALTE|nr:HAD-IA family hydrolase [Paraglaciecola sp. G1-23]MCF2947286.1 HAD-IA family hydrolase [Paraglaciecola sp. G1-23]